MFEKKTDKVKHESKPRDDGVELENQFILRIPEEPAKLLHEALQTGNLKDRLTIKTENDLRYGEVRFDHWLLHAKIVDLPTIIECLKTIDNKSFYKSADICQLMICKEEPDAPEAEKESPNKGKKKDPNKVDKKYLWPHGVTAPCKNIRKRRFRKTLKKKNVEAPEIEKEVKRLFRIDNDAVNVRYDIINEDEDEISISQQTKDQDIEDNDNETLNDEKQLNDSNSNKEDINVESDVEEELTSSAPIRGVGEHDIFGEEVSSSDDDEDRHNSSRLRDIEETSRLSADDSHMSDFSVGGGGGGGGVGQSSKTVVTEFNKSMFSNSPKGVEGIDDSTSKFGGSNSNLEAATSYFDIPKRLDCDDDYSNDGPQLTSEQIVGKITELRKQYEELKVQQAQKAQEISSIQNATLKQRMQETLDNLLSQMLEKEMEIKSNENMLYV